MEIHTRGDPPQTWFTLRFTEGWAAAYRLELTDGQPVIAEARVYPTGCRRLPWDERVRAAAPRGGLSARVLRALRPGEHLAAARKQLHRMANSGRPLDERAEHHAPAPGRPGFTRYPIGADDWDRDMLEVGGITANALDEPRGRGRPGRPEVEYAKIARDYVELLEQGSRRPTADLAAERAYSAAHMRDAVHRARALGLLSPPPARGQAGGALTDRALLLLADRGTTAGIG